MSQSDPVVVTQGLSKQYGEFRALDELSISLERGQILGFIGPNGAGKTTTIKILVGQLRPTSGTARIAGADCVRDASKIKWLVGYMPDTFGGYDNMRVREYLDFFGAAFKIPRSERKLRIEEVMEISGATYMKDRYLEGLSHGMKQRVAIARTLLHDPQVLILDEPANGLDPQARIEMRSILLNLAERGKTLIVTSHILPELSRICDMVAIMSRGQLRAFGTLKEITRTVGQRRTIEVQLVSPERLAQAMDLIREMLGSGEEVTQSIAESMIRFRSLVSEKRLAELLARLITARIPVAQFRELQTDLEDTFLSITRDNGEEDAPPRSDHAMHLPHAVETTS
ncbi:MAG: ABC transporter ATP-binding protein [Pirellulaceae bacterium]